MCRFVITKIRRICKIRWNAIGLNHQNMRYSFCDDSKTFNFKIGNKTLIYNQKVAKIIVFSILETKCEKCTIECIQNAKEP